MSNQNHTPSLIAVVLAVSLCGAAAACTSSGVGPDAAQAQPAPTQTAEPLDSHAPPRTIQVTGSAVISTAPDEFIVSVGVDSFDSQVLAAKQDNDARMAELLAVAKAHGVDAKDTQTSSFSVRPRHETAYGTNQRKLVGYDVQKTLTLVVKDAALLETVTTELFQRGANRLDGITFQSSKRIEKRWEAREQAVAAAKEKADVMAARLGQVVGTPIEVREGANMGGARGFGPGNVNFYMDNDTVASIGETFASGKVQIRAEVSVVFELVDPS